MPIGSRSRDLDARPSFISLIYLYPFFWAIVTSKNCTYLACRSPNCPEKGRRVKNSICIKITLPVRYGFGRFLILKVTISTLATHCLPLLLMKHLRILKKTCFIAGNRGYVNDVSEKSWSETRVVNQSTQLN